MADELPYKVAVVLDRSFGTKLGSLSENGPVWIVDSPENQAAAQLSRNQSNNHLDGITLVKASPTTTPEDTLIGNLWTIDLHHGEYSAPTPYSILEVIGTARSSAIQEALVEYAFDHFEDFPDGFRATRQIAK